jgi:hypothetical protein
VLAAERGGEDALGVGEMARRLVEAPLAPGDLAEVEVCRPEVARVELLGRLADAQAALEGRARASASRPRSRSAVPTESSTTATLGSSAPLCFSTSASSRRWSASASASRPRPRSVPPRFESAKPTSG